MQKVKINDDVIVLTGKEKGKNGKIIKINRKSGKVLVEGLNMVQKTKKSTQENPDGGFVKKESFLDISNVALVSPKTNKATRVRIETRDDKKVRVAVACGPLLD